MGSAEERRHFAEVMYQVPDAMLRCIHKVVGIMLAIEDLTFIEKAH
jgi:hypothetical protein